MDSLFACFLLLVNVKAAVDARVQHHHRLHQFVKFQRSGNRMLMQVFVIRKCTTLTAKFATRRGSGLLAFYNSHLFSDLYPN